MLKRYTSSMFRVFSVQLRRAMQDDNMLCVFAAVHSSCQHRFWCDVLRPLVCPQHVSSGAVRVARLVDLVEGFDGKIMYASMRRRETLYSQNSTDEGAQGIHYTARDWGCRTRCFHCAESISQKPHSKHRCFEEAPDFRSSSGNLAT